MDFSKMTTAEVEALLRLLADLEREELEPVIRERREVERGCVGAGTSYTYPPWGLTLPGCQLSNEL
jgi:hypothetical protein